jgi:hypothetical protein
MTRHLISLFFIVLALSARAQAIYSTADSMRISSILASIKDGGKQASTLQIAKEFIGVEYIASTLEQNINNEKLIVDVHSFDCTTFVESVVALTVTAAKEGDFTHYCKNLEKIRYRSGKCNGYASRLHYISQWICDSAKTDIIKEINTGMHTATQFLNLNFMSTHPGSYRQLCENPSLINEIIEHETPFRDISISYIPKCELNRSKTELKIEDGDIIAIVTAIDGLDVSHIGFAHWINGKLHLLHASSSEGCVILDDDTLYEYMQRHRKHLGIRVMRVEL